MTIDELRQAGLGSPRHACVEATLVRVGDDVDLPRSLAALESSLTFYRRELDEMRATARMWGAPVHDVSDNEDEYAARSVALSYAVEALRAVMATPPTGGGGSSRTASRP